MNELQHAKLVKVERDRADVAILQVKLDHATARLEKSQSELDQAIARDPGAWGSYTPMKDGKHAGQRSA